MPQKQEAADGDYTSAVNGIVEVFGGMRLTKLADPKIYLGMPTPILKQFLNALVAQHSDDEEKKYQNRLKYAGVTKERSSQTFKWDDGTYPMAEPGIIEEALSIGFIRERKNLVVLGPPGVGKSMLVTITVCKAIRNGFSARYKTAHAIAAELCEARSGNSLTGYIKRLSSCDVLAIDDLPYASFTTDSARDFFAILDARYERKSTIVTSNQSFGEWFAELSAPSMATGLVGRIAQESIIINMNGARDMRLKHAAEMMGVAAKTLGGQPAAASYLTSPEMEAELCGMN